MHGLSFGDGSKVATNGEAMTSKGLRNDALSKYTELDDFIFESFISQ